MQPLEVTRSNDICRITIVNDADIESPQLRDHVLAQLQISDCEVVLDISRVAMLRSIALASLVSVSTALHDHGRRFTLVGVNQRNHLLLTRTRLTAILGVA